jgi:hypothetical protein
MDRKKLALKVAAGLLITAVVSLSGVLMTSPGFAQVVHNFNWLFALRAFTGVMALAAGCTVFGIGIGINNETKYKWHAFVGFSVLTIVCVTMYAGLWK